MDKGNDLTDRGIFRPTRIGVDEWNDRRDYRTTYEGEFNLSDQTRRSTIFAGLVAFDIEPKTILHDCNDSAVMDMVHRQHDLFPETASAKRYNYESTFGFAQNNNQCDCCGGYTPSHNMLRDKQYHGLCAQCEREHEMDPRYNPLMEYFT